MKDGVRHEPPISKGIGTELTLEKLKLQVLWWNKAAIITPILVTGFLMLLWYTAICPPEKLFLAACGLYFLTAVIWWWWTMRGIVYLIKLLQQMNTDMLYATSELRGIREELKVDNQSDN